MTMYSFTKGDILAKAEQLGFITNGLEKMLRLINILGQLNSDPLFNNSLALKGGTAINLTIFNLPRLSHDIDLDFALPLSKEETLSSREAMTRNLGQRMAANGYEQNLARSKRTYALDSFSFSYTNAGGGTEAFKVEINYSLRAHVLPTVTRTVEVLDGAFGKLDIHSVHPIEIFASKIVALLSRATARDLYDLNSMIYHGLFDERELSLLKKCTIFYNAISGKGHDFTLGRLRTITNNAVRTQLLPMLRKRENFDYPTAQGRVHEFLSDLLRLEEKENLFMRAFSQGHYRPELLFDDKKILERIQNHPMAMWKTKMLLERNSRER